MQENTVHFLHGQPCNVRKLLVIMNSGKGNSNLFHPKFMLPLLYFQRLLYWLKGFVPL